MHIVNAQGTATLCGIPGSKIVKQNLPAVSQSDAGRIMAHHNWCPKCVAEADKAGVKVNILKVAGNLGEELNPYFLESSQGDIDGANRDLKKIVAATSRTVGTLVSKALRESRKFSGLFSEESEEEFRDDLVAMAISAVHTAK
jgi:hypothetical protein